MGDKKRVQFQCMNCGHLYWIEDPPKIDEDELYMKMKCGRCKEMTQHLWVGERDEDKYVYYDLSKDLRYF